MEHFPQSCQLQAPQLMVILQDTPREEEIHFLLLTLDRTLMGLLQYIPQKAIHKTHFLQVLTFLHLKDRNILGVPRNNQLHHNQ